MVEAMDRSGKNRVALQQHEGRRAHLAWVASKGGHEPADQGGLAGPERPFEQDQIPRAQGRRQACAERLRRCRIGKIDSERNAVAAHASRRTSASAFVSCLTSTLAGTAPV